MDFDETLLDNSIVPASVERACDAIAAVVRSLDPAELLTANTAAWNWPEVERRCWVGEMEVLDVSREVWSRALHSWGRDDQAVVDFAYETHQQIGREMSRLFDDVPGFLRALQAEQITMALVTNSSVRAQMATLEAVGLESAFAAVVISGEIGIAKPDPAIFDVAL
ncbi:MAG: HAD family hydrolase, partial [Acidimicrobiales bacterium]